MNRSNRRLPTVAAGAAALVALAAIVLIAVAIQPGTAGPSPQSFTPGTSAPSQSAPTPSAGGSATHPPAAFWRVSSGFVTLWRWEGDGLAFWFTVAGGKPFLGYDTFRVLASPDGRRVAVSERSNGQAAGRVRVFDDAGSVLWSTSTGTDDALDIAWSADSTAFGFGLTGFTQVNGSFVPQPRPWTVVTFSPNGDINPTTYQLPGTAIYRLLAFTGDGNHVVGYDTTSYESFWQKPVSMDLARGVVTSIERYPAKLSQASTGPVAQIDPSTGKVLALVGPANAQRSWAEIDGASQTPVGVPANGSSIAWADDGRIAMSELLNTGSVTNPTFVSRISVIEAAGATPTEVARLPAGHHATLVGVRQGQTLITTFPWPAASYPADPGQSDVGYVDLATGAVTFAFPPPAGVLFDGIEFAGWITR